MQLLGKDDDSRIQDSFQPGDCTQLDRDLGKAVWYSLTVTGLRRLS